MTRAGSFRSLSIFLLLWPTAATLTLAADSAKKVAATAALEERIAILEKSMAERVTALEQQVAQLKQQLDARPAVQAPAPPVEDPAATAMRIEADTLAAGGKILEARAKYEELATKYPQSTATRASASVRGELQIVGRAAPGNLEIDKWYQGEDEGKKSLTSKATLLVFWETWCPHCQREVPKMTDIYSRFKDKGLAVVGLTRLTKGSTDEAVLAFIKERAVAYPIAKEKGTLSTFFNVSGIPAAAVVKDGKIVWRGHPNRLNDELIKSWL